jgi:hypothetical protein
VLISGAVCAFLAILGMYFYFSWQQVILAKETLCPVDGARSLTAILVDRTDPLTPVQREALRKRLDSIKNEMGRHEGVVVYSVGPIGDNLLRPEAPLLCNPGHGTDILPAVGNPRLVERKWREQFSAPLDRLFNELTEPHESPTSPIMESVQSVAITALRGQQIDKIPRRLVIVSDMLHHTSEYSQYTTITSFQAFRQSPYYRRVRADLRGIAVELIYVRRETKRSVQGQKHIEFWQQYITDMGGILTHVISLEG